MPCVFNNHYFQSGRYSHWLTFYQSEFGSDSILILPFEDLAAHPTTTLEVVWHFLHVPSIGAFESQKENPTTLIRFPSLFRAYAALGRYGRRAIAGWLPPRTMETLTYLYRRSGGKLLSATNVGKPPSMDGEARRWIAEHYRTDVRELRNAHPGFRHHWTSDFPD
jgi:hypothetical protein